MCRFCFNKLSNKDCPACRTPYNNDNFVLDEVLMQQWEKKIAEIHQREKLETKKKREGSDQSTYHEALPLTRVVQRNLVYVVAFPSEIAKDTSFLKSTKMFGQYGKVLKLVPSKVQKPSNTCALYVTYSSAAEAKTCIQAVHGSWFAGRDLSASFGTTKYCANFLNNRPCNNPECLYLHELGPYSDSKNSLRELAATLEYAPGRETFVNDRFQSRELPAPVRPKKASSVVPEHSVPPKMPETSPSVVPSITTQVKQLSVEPEATPALVPIKQTVASALTEAYSNVFSGVIYDCLAQDTELLEYNTNRPSMNIYPVTSICTTYAIQRSKGEFAMLKPCFYV